MEASFSAFLLLFCALFSSQTVALKDGPTIGFISPDVVSDIGKQKVLYKSNLHTVPKVLVLVKNQLKSINYCKPHF